MRSWIRNRGISVTNEVRILAAGECAGCWTGEDSRVDARQILCNVKSRDGRTPSSRQDQSVDLRRRFAERKLGAPTLSHSFFGCPTV